MRNIKILIVFFTFLSLIVPANAELSKESIYNKLKDTYKNLENISFNYSLESNANLFGYIKAAKGNKYIISMPDRDIFCNAELIWNVSKSDKKVIISNYEADDEDALSIENVFFYFLDQYDPSRLVKENSSKGFGYYVLTLTPSNNENKFQDIDRITLWLSYNGLEIEKVRLEGFNINDTFILSDIKRNVKIKNSDFNFVPPEDMEIIDFR
jgi:outer membrane lipoprotein-sorting protein